MTVGGRPRARWVAAIVALLGVVTVTGDAHAQADAPAWPASETWPTDATATSPDVAPEAAIELPQRAYDDGVGVDEVPWDDAHPKVHYLPLGTIHLGLQLRLGFFPGADAPLSAGPVSELSGFLDTRFNPRDPWRLRIAIAASIQPTSENLPGVGTVEQSSPFALRTRLLYGMDIEQLVTVRLGVGLGLQWVPLPDSGRLCAMFENLQEIAFRLFDGRAEAAISGGVQLTAVGVANRSGDECELRAQPVVGGSIAYVLP
jgi:hypothetical protein